MASNREGRNSIWQGCGIKGFLPTSVIQRDSPLYIGGVVFGRLFLLDHRSGHFPQPWYLGELGCNYLQVFVLCFLHDDTEAYSMISD